MGLVWGMRHTFLFRESPYLAIVNWCLIASQELLVYDNFNIARDLDDVCTWWTPLVKQLTIVRFSDSQNKKV